MISFAATVVEGLVSCSGVAVTCTGVVRTFESSAVSFCSGVAVTCTGVVRTFESSAVSFCSGVAVTCTGVVRTFDSSVVSFCFCSFECTVVSSTVDRVLTSVC